MQESSKFVEVQEYHKKLIAEVEDLRKVKRLRDQMPRICHFQLACSDDGQVYFTFIAPGICDIFGCSEDDEDKSVESVLKRLGAEEVIRFKKLVIDECSSENIFTFVTELDDNQSLRFRGRPRLCHHKGQLVDGYLYLYDSSSSQKKTQIHLTRHLALGIEQSNDAFILMNLDGGIIYANKAASKVFGSSDKSTIFDFDSLVIEGTTFRELWSDALDGKTFRDQVTRQLPSGERIVLVQSVAPVFGNEGNLASLLAVCHDITEQSELEERVYKSVRMEAIGNLSAGIAHDFNNVLTAIMCRAATAKEACEPHSDSAVSYGKIIAAGHRASDLVDQILVFGGNVEAEACSLLLSPLIKESVKIVKTWADTDITFIEKLEAALAINANPTHLHQIITNLCSNAVKAIEDVAGEKPDSMRDGGVVTISTEQVDGMVKISVSDTGCGMDEELQRNALEPSFTTRKRGQGTGIGLAVVQDLVTLYGGTLHIKSIPGEGTSISIKFPLTDFTPDDISHPTVAASIKGNERILIVDDEHDVLEAVSSGLEKFGYDVTSFTSPAEALQWNGLEDVHLVVSDLTMSEMNGRSFLKSVSELCPDKLAILCSGYDEESHNHVFLRKPFTPRKLAAVIRTQLDVKPLETPENDRCAQ